MLATAKRTFFFINFSFILNLDCDTKTVSIRYYRLTGWYVVLIGTFLDEDYGLKKPFKISAGYFPAIKLSIVMSQVFD